MNLLIAGALGLALGVVTGMPLGVINVSIVEAATAGRRRFAIGLGIGGGLADTVHAGLAFAGVGRLITAREDWMRAAAIVAAVLIVGYAIVTWRRERVPLSSSATALVTGIATGFSLTLPNPAALGAWVAVAASIWPSVSLDAAVAVALGVGLGSAVWFGMLARWISSIRSDHPARRYIPRIAIVSLVAIAVAGGVRAWL